MMTSSGRRPPATVPATRDVPLDIVFGFSGETITVSALTVDSLAPAAEAGRTGSIELLVSSLSPHTGFQSLRTCRLKDVDETQEFTFVETGCRWIMLRLTPAGDQPRMELPQVSLLGNLGRPATHYAFDQSPAEALQVIAQLQKLVTIALTDDEVSLFADARDGRLDEWSFAEAALVASGATDRGQRQAYLRQLDALTDGAREATAGSASAFEKGQKLLVFLHAQSLKQGYSSQQTDLSTLLDTATYNCVSSATLYNVMGRRLGLDVRAVEVPDHAFSILYEGTQHADVEVTTEGGFNPSRDPAVLKQFTERTGKNYIADLHPEKRREIGAAGLVGIIYYNHGVTHSKNKQYADALVRYFCALSLDPESASAVKNALSTLANWSVELSEAEQFETGLAVVNAGLELAPQDATLLNNRLAIWHDYIESAMDSGGSAEALKLVREAGKQIPDGSFREMEAWVFLRKAEQYVEESKWDTALATAQAGIAKVNRDAQKELVDWRKGLFLRWSNRHLENQEYAQALSALEQGLAVEQRDPRIVNNIGYVVQEWTRDLAAQNRTDEAEALLSQQFQKHRDADIASIASSYVSRQVKQLTADEEYQRALKLIERCVRLIPAAGDHTSAQRYVYDSWASKSAQNADWKHAVEVYDMALEALPGNAHLLHNRLATYQQWARKCTDAGQWLEAADVLRRSMNAHPKDDLQGHAAWLTGESTRDVFKRHGWQVAEEHLSGMLARFPVEAVRHAAAVFVQDTAEQLAKENKYDEAIRTIARGEDFLEDDPLLRESAQRIYDDRSARLAKHNEWSRAVEVYAQGLRRYPGDDHLTHNAIVTWDAWARIHLDKQEWAAAIEIYQRALTAFPDANLLKNNLAYCKQQLSTQ